MKKKGLFGGTFDPVHLGHSAMVRAALAHGLEEVLVMPCFLSPHKLTGPAGEPPSDGQHRYEMLRLAFQGFPGVRISCYEIERERPSYTWQTLEYLRDSEPGVEWTLMIGLDQYAALPHWHRFETWSGLVKILVFKRRGVEWPALDNGGHSLECVWSEAEIPDVSATEVRRRAKQGDPLDGLVLPEVAGYIKKQNLYLTLPDKAFK